MNALVGGLGAALSWSAAALAASRSSRLIGAASATALVMASGLLVTLPFVVAQGVPDALDGSALAWLALSGGGNVAGLLVMYFALRRGRVGLVTAIISTEGAIAALISVAAGERIGATLGLAMTVVAVGVVVTASATPHRADVPDDHRRSLVLAGVAAAIFATSLYATGRVSDLPAAWVVLPARLIGTAVLALPLVAAGRLRLAPRRALPLVLVSGMGEVTGFASFTLGARDSIAVTSVIASQVATVAAALAFVLFRERLTRRQVLGVIVTVGGVAATGFLSA